MEVTNTAQSERARARATQRRIMHVHVWGLQIATSKTRLQVLMTSNRSCSPRTIDRVQSVELQVGSWS